MCAIYVNLEILSIEGNFRQNPIISTDSPTDPSFTCPGNGFFPLNPTACSTTFYNCVGGIAYIEVNLR